MSYTIEDARAMERADPKEYAGLVQRMERRQAKLRRQARASFRAMEEWSTLQDEADWVRTCKEAANQYRSGHFLLDRLGAEHYLDPTLMATIWGLRQHIIEDEKIESAAEMMLLDLAVLAYFNALRVQRWIGDLAIHIEHEWFGMESPTADFERQHGRFRGLKVEAAAKRFAEQLLPLMDPANRLVIRNLRAIRELREPPAAPVQVNVGAQQLNMIADSETAKRRRGG